MKKSNKKAISIAVSLCMTAALLPSALADNEAVINEIAVEDGIVKSADLTVTDTGDYKLYAAVYDDEGRLAGIAGTDAYDGTVTFDEELAFDSETQQLKCMIWYNDDNVVRPVSDAFVLGTEPEATDEPETTDEPEATDAPEATAEPEATDAPETTDEPEATAEPEEGYFISFDVPEHVSVILSTVQSFDDASTVTEGVTGAYARNGSTGEIDTSGSGQVNFKVAVDEGYSAQVTASGAYKNLKQDPEGTGDNDTYRITKITGEVSVAITVTADDPDSTEAPTFGTGTITLSDEGITYEGDYGVEIAKNTATINLAGNYTVEGSASDAQIVVNYTPAVETQTVTLTLNGITLTSTTGNAIDALAGTLTIASAADTESTVTSTAGVAIYSADDMEIKGEGLINAISETGNGIRCKSDLQIGAGDLYVKAANNGIKGDNSVKITKKAGNITVVSDGDGIKSDNAPTVKKPAREGIVTINGGTIDITTGTTTDEATGEVSTGDGIQADTLLTIAGGAITIDAKGEALKSNFSHLDLMSTEGYDAIADQLSSDGQIVISGGTLNASAGEDGIKAVKSVTVSGGSTTVIAAQEGIQVKEIVYSDEAETIVSGYVEGEVAVSGGTLNITASEDGIQCGTGNVVISDGDITIASVQDGIQAENILDISGGTFDIKTNGGAPSGTAQELSYSCKGLKAQNLINVSGGTFNISSYDDSIHSNHTVRLSGGTITAESGDDGVHGDSFLYITDNAYVDVTKSYEGIEAAEIYVQGGETRVAASDDGANAAGDQPSDKAYDLTSNVPQLSYDTASTSEASGTAELMAGGPGGWGGPGGGGGFGPQPGGEDTSNYGYLEVSGGLLYIEAEGDGFDSNGDGVISGGTVLVNGPTSGGNGVFDVGDNNNTLKITGGTVIGAGTSDMPVVPTSTTGSQYYVLTGSSSQSGGRPGQQSGSSLSTQSAGKAFQIKNSSGTVIATYVPSKSYAWVFVSTPDITSGSYTMTYGGSVSGGTYTGSSSGLYGLVSGGTFSGSSSMTLTATK